MTLPRTAAALLTVLTNNGAHLRVEGRDLVCDGDVPDVLDDRLKILHTGVRALLMNLPWYGIDRDTGFGDEMNPESTLPDRIGLLCVSGDSKWDRVHDWDREYLPDLFHDDGKRRRRQPGAQSGRRVYFIPLRAG